jgi:hypothetical protein
MPPALFAGVWSGGIPLLARRAGDTASGILLPRHLAHYFTWLDYYWNRNFVLVLENAVPVSRVLTRMVFSL